MLKVIFLVHNLQIFFITRKLSENLLENWVNLPNNLFLPRRLHKLLVEEYHPSQWVPTKNKFKLKYRLTFPLWKSTTALFIAAKLSFKHASLSLGVSNISIFSKALIASRYGRWFFYSNINFGFIPKNYIISRL